MEKVKFMIDQHPDEWYELRRTGIGGSDAAAVLGESKWKTPYKVWREKVFGERDPDKAQYERGRELEPSIRRWYEKETGKKVYVPSFMRDPKYDFICGNIDGRTDDKVIEIKTALYDDWGDTPPNAYVLQCQHYLYLTGYDECDLVVRFLATWTHKVYTIHANPELQELMIKHYQAFWKYVETKTPPPAKTLDDLKLMFPASKNETKTLSQGAIDAYQALIEKKKQLVDIETDIDALEFQIKSELGEFDTGVNSDGKVLCTWKTSKPRQTLDTARLKMEEPGIYNSYLKQGNVSRTFLLKEIK